MNVVLLFSLRLWKRCYILGREVAEFAGPDNDGPQNNNSWKMQDLEMTDLGTSKVANNGTVGTNSNGKRVLRVFV